VEKGSRSKNALGTADSFGSWELKKLSCDKVSFKNCNNLSDKGGKLPTRDVLWGELFERNAGSE